MLIFFSRRPDKDHVAQRSQRSTIGTYIITLSLVMLLIGGAGIGMWKLYTANVSDWTKFGTSIPVIVTLCFAFIEWDAWVGRRTPSWIRQSPRRGPV